LTRLSDVSRENYQLRNHELDNRMLNEPKLIKKFMKIDYLFDLGTSLHLERGL